MPKATILDLPRRSKPRCWPRCAAPAIAICWPCTYSALRRPADPDGDCGSVVLFAHHSLSGGRGVSRPAVGRVRRGGDRPGVLRRRLTVLSPALKRSVVAILHSVPRLCGWCRTRWSCATIAVELYTRRKIAVSAETVRRWLHELDWEWKRAKLRAKDDDPQRVEKLARIRCAFEQLRAGAALFFADELDIHLLPKVGYQWMPTGTQVQVMTPGTNEKRYLA